MSSPSRRRFLHTTAVLGGTWLATHGPAENMRPVAAEESAPHKKIDCHLHINHFDRSIEDTLAHMDATGTERAFVLPLETGEGGVVLHAETVLHAWHQYPERIIPFCQTDIRRDDVLQRVRAYHLLGCRGIGEQKEHLPLADRRVEAIIALCDDLNWPITLHFQDGPSGYNQGLAEQLEVYLKRYRRVRIIGHAQTWWANISAEVPSPTAPGGLYPQGPVKPGGLLDRLLSEYPNLYADMSAGSGYGALSRDEDFTRGFIERHPDQLLFGSDCPCRDGRGENFKGTCYAQQLEALLRRLVDDPQTMRKLCYDNALRALEGTVAS